MTASGRKAQTLPAVDPTQYVGKSLVVKQAN